MTSLARLAVDTGGRFTERTNDLTLGYARAQRDLGCTYSLGFYVDEGEEDRPQNVVIRVKREGLRAVHPAKYLFRSPETKRSSLLTAAWAAPEMFQTGVVRAHVFPLRPSSKDSWDGLLAVSFRVPLGNVAGEQAQRNFGAVLHRGAKMAHRFSRSIKLEPDGADVTSEPVITFLDRVDLKPGRYTMTAVMSDPHVVEPHAYKLELQVPEVPANELFLVGPVLGRAAGYNLVVMAGDEGEDDDKLGRSNSFEPLLIQQLEEPVDLITLTQACFIGSKRRQQKALSSFPSVNRRLLDTDGDALGELSPVDTALEADGAVHCQNLVDVLPTSTLPDGEYEFEARLPSDRGRDGTRSVRFAIRADSFR